MGSGSRNYAWYYVVCALLYLAISIAAFVEVGSHSAECTQVCPLLIEDGADGELQYSACACYDVTDPLNGEAAAYGFPSSAAFNAWQASSGEARTQLSLNRFNEVSAIQGSCYICNSETPSSVSVFQPCDTFSLCTTPGVEGFKQVGLSELTDSCKILAEPPALLRGTVVSVLYAFAVFFLLMGLASALISWGYFIYADKWDDDFRRLSKFESAMGFIAKNAPMVVRTCNFFVVFFLIYSLVLVLGYEVCKTETDKNGVPQVFFNTIRRLTLAILGIWLIGCVCGTAFNRLVPRDTPFYAPKTPTDNRDGKCYRCVVASFHLLFRTGP